MANEYLTGNAFQQIVDNYTNREKAVNAWKEQGGKVIAYLGDDVPEEILISAGYLPIRVYGNSKGQTKIADKYLELAFDPVVRSQFDKIVGGKYTFAEHLVITYSTDVLLRIFYYLRQIHSVEPEVPVPDTYFIDFLFTRFLTSTLYNRDRLNNFKKIVEQWSGKEISDETLKKATALCEKNRRLLREIGTLRAAGSLKISGTEALQIIGSSLFMPKDEHNKLLEEVIIEAKNKSDLRGAPIFVTGSVHEEIDFYQIVENHGGIIVGEDHDWGNRHAAGSLDLTINPLHAIVDRVQTRLASPKKTFVFDRVTALIEEVRKSGAKAVIFYFRKNDDASSWDYPEQKKALENMGIKTLLLVKQPYDLTEAENLDTIVSEFIQTMYLREGKTQNG